MRIVSLLPSATEVICALGLRDHLVGVTHECDYPTSVIGLPVLTRSLIPQHAASGAIDSMVREQLAGGDSLYTLDAELFGELSPDIVVTQTLCSVCAVAEDEVQRAVAGLPRPPEIVNLEPQTWADVVASFHQVARAAGVEEAGAELERRLNRRLEQLASAVGRHAARPTVIFLEWLVPPFSAGHWTPELVSFAGGKECLGDAGDRSRPLSWDDVRDADPDVIVVACCGFSTERTLEDLRQLNERTAWTSLRAVQQGRVFVIDGSQYFSRPGPRLVDGVEVLAHCLHPDRVPLPPGVIPPKVAGSS